MESKQTHPKSHHHRWRFRWYSPAKIERQRNGSFNVLDRYNPPHFHLLYQVANWWFRSPISIASKVCKSFLNAKKLQFLGVAGRTTNFNRKNKSHHRYWRLRIRLFGNGHRFRNQFFDKKEIEHLCP
jgi:hypothetical protein